MRWFSSDWHIGHANIIDFCNRPYSSVPEMNAALLANHNALVNDDDDVYLVGDMVMGRFEDGLATLDAMRGNKHLVSGNHDKTFRGRKGWQRWIHAYEEVGVTVLEHQIVVNIDDRPVQVCHFPYFGVSKPHGYDDKFSGQRPDDIGGWLICGHVHDAWTVKDRQINVGVDVWQYRPVPEFYIAEIIRQKEEA